MTVPTIRSDIATLGLFCCLDITFIFLVIGIYRDMDILIIRIGGGVGALTAALAWYIAMAKLWNYGNSWIKLPLGTLPWTARARPKPLPWKRSTGEFIRSDGRWHSK
jgi:succinate-acetate transporter protein